MKITYCDVCGADVSKNGGGLRGNYTGTAFKVTQGDRNLAAFNDVCYWCGYDEAQDSLADALKEAIGKWQAGRKGQS